MHPSDLTGPAWAEGDDAGLLQGIIDRRPEALAEVYARHGGAMWARACRIGGRGQADAVVQDVFLRLWSHPQAFGADHGPLGEHLVLAAHDRVVARVPWRRAGGSDDDVQRPRAGRAAVEAADLGEDMWHLVARLPSSQREAIAIAHRDGSTYAQVADELGLPLATTMARIRAGLATLHALLADERQGQSAP